MSGRPTIRWIAIRTVLSVSLVFACAGSAAAQDALAKQRAEFAAKTNPVDKAKVLAKLSSREMTALRDLVSAGDDETALAALEQYRDNVTATTQALVATGIDAARRSGGFKDLQISLRMFIRRLDDLMFSLQQDLRPAFRAARTDLETAENFLIDALFPVRSPRRPVTAGSQ